MPKTYEAKLFLTPYRAYNFHIAGTLDGQIDLALPDQKRTYQLNLDEAESLARALLDAVKDVAKNCPLEDSWQSQKWP